MAPTTFEQKLAHLKREAEHYADYLSDEEVEDEVATKAHEEADFCNDYSMAVVVGGLPVVDEAKHGKLLNVVKKIFGQVGAVVDIHMPFGASGKTTGYAFVEYDQEAHANDAVRTINNFALDKRHTMLVNKYADIERFQQTPAEFVASKVDKFTEPKNLQTWLTDPARRDMFMPSMKLLEKKSLRADGVHDFFWSPTDPILAYWAPEGNNVPARVSLVELPSRREVRQKNLFNVSDCKLHWHPNGTFLCVKVTRHSKSKKTLYTNFELFRVHEQLVPVEMLEVKENIVAFAWEPKGTRFATVHGEGQQRLNVSFYDMDGGSKGAKEVTLLYTLADKACSHLYWSPLGNNIVLAGLGEINGQLEFWDANEQQSITVQEHFKCTHVEWDPSGRVVATAVCQPLDNSYYKFTMDNGYTLWTFQGKQLLEEKKDAFYQFLWRPRPRTLLSDDEYNHVVKNLKKFEKRFDQMDRLKERERLAAEKAERNRKENEFQELLEKRLATAAARRAEYVALLGGYDSEDESEYIVQSHTYDDVLEIKEEVMRK
uniref:Eukaryotic translation initiation factor 3 subunit B n=1 Tax=Phytophthora ramorum TaxID=164328 RepID=H3HC45_PHYRM